MTCTGQEPRLILPSADFFLSSAPGAMSAGVSPFTL